HGPSGGLGGLGGRIRRALQIGDPSDMNSSFVMSAGRAAPLGATFDGDGVNFAVFSEHATRMQLCLFSDDGKHELVGLDLPERDGDVWHGYISGLRPGQQYGLRAHGPYAPQEG